MVIGWWDGGDCVPCLYEWNRSVLIVIFVGSVPTRCLCSIESLAVCIPSDVRWKSSPPIWRGGRGGHVGKRRYYWIVFYRE